MRGGEGGEAIKYKNGSRCFFFFILELNYTIKHRSDVEYYLIIELIEKLIIEKNSHF